MTKTTTNRPPCMLRAPRCGLGGRGEEGEKRGGEGRERREEKRRESESGGGIKEGGEKRRGRRGCGEKGGVRQRDLLTCHHQASEQSAAIVRILLDAGASIDTQVRLLSFSL